MATPVIDPRTSIQTAKVGEAFTFQLAAFNTPTSWTALHLPAGISINSSTGLISGTPTVSGLYQVAIRASNTDGEDQIFLLIPVLDEEIDEERMGEWNDLVLDFDLTGRKVTLHSGGGGENGLFPVGKGDSMDVLIGFYRDGVLCDVNPNGEEMSVKMALKEFEPEILLTLVGGTPEKVVVGDSVRYRVKCYIDPVTWGPVLSNYEADAKTAMIAVSEIELVVGVPLYAQTKATSPFAIMGNMTGLYGDNPVVNRTLVFNGFTSEGNESYLLTLTLAVAGRPLQGINYQRTMKIEKVGGVWTVTEIAGPSSGSGQTEGDSWIATMENIDIEGDSDSVDVDMRVTTSEDGSGLYAFDFNVEGYKAPYVEFDLRNPSAVCSWDKPFYLALATDADQGALILPIGGMQRIIPSHIDDWDMVTPAKLFEGFSHAYAGTFSTSEPHADVHLIEAVGPYVVRVWLKSTTTVRNAFSTISTPPADYSADWPSSFPVVTPGTGTSASATISGLLIQTTGIRPARYTGQFKVEVIRDLVPDQ